jgi:hypothetical protein
MRLWGWFIMWFQALYGVLLFAKWMSVKPLEVCFFDESKLFFFFFFYLVGLLSFGLFGFFFFVSVLVDLSF